MAAARHRAQRLWIYQQAAMVWKPIDNRFALEEFIRTGQIGAEGPKTVDPPEVQAVIDEIHRNGGKLIIKPEVPSGGT